MWEDKKTSILIGKPKTNHITGAINRALAGEEAQFAPEDQWEPGWGAWWATHRVFPWKKGGHDRRREFLYLLYWRIISLYSNEWVPMPSVVLKPHYLVDLTSALHRTVPSLNHFKSVTDWMISFAQSYVSYVG